MTQVRPGPSNERAGSMHRVCAADEIADLVSLVSCGPACAARTSQGKARR